MAKKLATSSNRAQPLPDKVRAAMDKTKRQFEESLQRDVKVRQVAAATPQESKQQERIQKATLNKLGLLEESRQRHELNLARAKRMRESLRNRSGRK